MIALDTNILARFYMEADPSPATAKQVGIAKKLFESGKRLFVPLSVILELEWVVRGAYKCKRTDFVAIIRHLAGFDLVEIERLDLVMAALDHHQNGLDFADAMHLCASHGCTELASFDRPFSVQAKKLKLKPLVVSLAD